jgi:hypothetical protein
MQIHSISKALSFPLLVLGGYFLYRIFVSPFESDSIYILIPVVLLVCLYVFHGPLDHWWLTKYPIKFDDKLRDWLTKYFNPYTLLSEDAKKLFENRMTLYLEGRLFQSVGSEHRDVPHDIQCMVAAHGLIMTLNRKDYLMGDMDRIFLYKHPFPTPRHQYLHNVEVDTEDGVIILSLEQLTNAVLYPQDYYNVGYHAFAEAFIATQKDIIYPDVVDSWSDIEAISGWSKEVILSQTGMKELSTIPVHITIYFSFPEKYKAINPERYQSFKSIFGK